MEQLRKTFVVDIPVRAAYDQWTAFEEFPRFIDGIEEVRQLDETHLHWRASLAGKEKEWEAEITEQESDTLIAWRSTSGTPNAGRVSFESLGTERTRIDLQLEYEPETALEKAGAKLGLVSRQIDKTVDDFKYYMERRGRSTPGRPPPK